MRRRRLLTVAVGLLALIGVLVTVARIYLGSHSAARQVAARLEATLGAPVRLQRLDVRSGGISLEGLEIFQPGAEAGNSPWLSAREVRTDVTLLDALEGRTTPGDIVLIEPALTLHFDQAGRLLTRLPR